MTVRVILDTLPDPLPSDVERKVIGRSGVIVDGVEKPALYFENHDLDLAASLGGEILITE